MKLKVTGVAEAVSAFETMPRAIANKHVRIALNAGAGVIRNRAASIARKNSGLLSRSLGIKVKVPDASYNSKHHGRPAYAVIGPRRNISGAVTPSGSSLGARVLGTKKAVLKAAFNRKRVIRRKPSRYAHLVENDHKTRGGKHVMGYSFLDTAVRTEGSSATAKMLAKLKQGAEQEALTIGRASSAKLPPMAR